MMLRVTSSQAENTYETGRAITAHLGKRLGIDTQFVLDLPWLDHMAALLRGEIHVGWICGLWYARQAARPRPPLELLATPVYSGARYENRPVYFSDVVVHRDNPVTRFADLRGSTWAYNEPDSLSGNYVMQRELAERNLDTTFFGRLIESGGHLLSLEMLAEGRADVAAIDSTVWEYAQETRPVLCNQLRVFKVLGPNPGPPWVVSCRVPVDLRAQIQEALLDIHSRPEGKILINKLGLSHFAMVDIGVYRALTNPVFGT